jgi:transcriptional regulator with XRE-family HTH domain
MESLVESKAIHVGRNLKKFRIVRGLSQTDVAVALEKIRKKPVSQQLVSDIEERQTIEDEELLGQYCQILKVDPEVVKKLDLDDAINVIGNNFHDNATQQINFKNTVNNSQAYNQLDKLIELFEKEKAELKGEIEKLRKQREN